MHKKENIYLLFLSVFIILTFVGDRIIISVFDYIPDTLGLLVFIWPVLALITGVLYSNTRKKRMSVDPTSETTISATANDLANFVLWALVIVILLFLLFAFIFAKGIS